MPTDWSREQVNRANLSEQWLCSPVHDSQAGLTTMMMTEPLLATAHSGWYRFGAVFLFAAPVGCQYHWHGDYALQKGLTHDHRADGDCATLWSVWYDVCYCVVCAVCAVCRVGAAFVLGSTLSCTRCARGPFV
jgi:hypothetical protein